jgi:hypothetical protein
LNYSKTVWGYFRRRDRGWILSLIFAVCICYLPFLGNQFVFDDIRFLSTDLAKSNNINTIFDLNLRWLPYASLAWTADIFSDAVPHFFHLGNTLLHAANVILLFYLLRQLLGTVAARSEQQAVVRGAWLAALLFALHPVAVYAVGYVVQRSILMATFFALVMLFAYLRALLTGQKRWLFLSVLAYFLAGFSKEHSVLMPAVVLALHISLRANKQAVLADLGKAALGWCWSAFTVIGVLLLLRAKGVLGVPYEPMAAFMFEQQGQVATTPMLYLLSALTQAGLFFKYLLLWLLPNPAWMSVDMREHFITSLNEWQGWAGGLAFIVYGVIACRLLLQGGVKGLIGFALLYPWLQFIVEFSVIRVQEPFVLYRSYLWMPCLLLLVSLLLIELPSIKMLLALCMIALLLLPLTWNRLWIFGDKYRLWNDAAIQLSNEHVSGADRIFFNRGQAQAVAHNWGEAVTDFKRVVALSPQLAPVHYELGMAYLNLGDGKEALAQFNESIAINQFDGRYYFGKGLALMKLHQLKLAQQQLQKSCELGEQTACMIAGFSQPVKIAP